MKIASFYKTKSRILFLDIARVNFDSERLGVAVIDLGGASR